MTSDTIEESNLLKHARAELQQVGLLDSDADYDGYVGATVLRMIEAFSWYGHSGGSAAMTLEVFNRLAQFKTLGPITDNPAEWMRVNPDDEEVGIWQNRRQGSLFSNDGGKTYYDIDEQMVGDEQPTHESKEHTSA
jgi:hypothetical protein